MKTTIAALLGIAVGALVVFLCNTQYSHETSSATVGRYQFISSEEMKPNEKAGILSGMYDRVLDSATGKIYTRMWGLHKIGTNIEDKVTFMVLDPVGMSTNAEYTVNARGDLF